ncbi:MAG: tRNA-2-methylthio-N(6)-dimethylallyladenosine synthase [Desulfovibrio sp.]
MNALGKNEAEETRREGRQSFALLTFGCKVNQYESHALREAWFLRGFSEADEKTAAVVCVTTCAVTAKGVADARAAIRRVHRENPAAAIIVTGCAAQVFGKELGKLEGVALVVPQQEKARLLYPGETLLVGESLPDDSALPPAVNAADFFPPFAVTGYDRSRAVLKVQDGCSHRCTYCIVPLTRGRSVSRDPAATVAEARRLLDAGFREIVLNGINLAQYGRDFAHPHDFWDLVTLLEKELTPEWAGRARLRLSSLEPGQLGAKALDVLGHSSLVAPHLHISLQSGSYEVLRRMGRGHYNPGVLHGFCRDLAQVFPLFGLGADVLSGFPGETDAHAAENEAFLESLPFSYAHVFPYSRRPGTPAANWPEHVESAVKKERAARLRAIFAVKNAAFLERCAALPEVTVAWEESTPGGVNEYYGECVFTEGKEPLNASRRELVKAKPVGVYKGKLLVEPFSEPLWRKK